MKYFKPEYFIFVLTDTFDLKNQKTFFNSFFVISNCNTKFLHPKTLQMYCFVNEFHVYKLI